MPTIKELPGSVVKQTKARSTGTTIQLIDNRDGHMESEPGLKWFTVCVEHDGCMGHGTRHVAASWMPEPESWCEQCNEEYYA